MDETDQIIKALDAQMRKKLRLFRKRGSVFNPDDYILFAPQPVIKKLRGRGNTKTDVVVDGQKIRCRVGSYPDIQRRTTGVRR